jgi:hypothetical protein
MSERRRAVTVGGAAAGIAGLVAAVARRSKTHGAGASASARAQPQASLDGARRVRSERLAEMKSLPYSELVRYCDEKLACEVLGMDGVKYAHETQAFYDDKPGGTIRVRVEVSAYDAAAGDWTTKMAGGGLLVPPGDEPPAEWLDEQSGS